MFTTQEYVKAMIDANQYQDIDPQAPNYYKGISFKARDYVNYIDHRVASVLARKKGFGK